MLKLASILSFNVKPHAVHRAVIGNWQFVGWLVGWLVMIESIAFEFLDRHLMLCMYILGTAFIIFSLEINYCVSY